MRERLMERLCNAMENIGVALHALGNKDAITPFGAIENLALEIKNAGEGIAGGLNAVAEAIRETNERS